MISPIVLEASAVSGRGEDGDLRKPKKKNEYIQKLREGGRL